MRDPLNGLGQISTALGSLILTASIPIAATTAIDRPEPTLPPATPTAAIVVVQSPGVVGPSLKEQLSAQSAVDERWLRTSSGVTGGIVTTSTSRPFLTPSASATATPGTTSTATPTTVPTPARTPAAQTRNPAPYVDAKLSVGVPRKIRLWEEEIQRYARRYDVDPHLVAAVMMTESSGDPEAVSPANAIGLMQVLDGPSEPEANIAAGTRMLSNFLYHYGKIDMALAAYNAGPGNVARYGGIPPFPETYTHISRTLASYSSYAAAGIA